MPFLFVDYDQGAGGESFCHGLSQSAECVPLSGFKNSKNRTKINDVFGQEFLKSIPQPTIVTDATNLYNLVPSHRNTTLAYSTLKNVYSIRIANPIDENLWQYLKHQQITKVFRSTLPSGSHFIGEVEMLARGTPNRDWIKKVKSNMDNLSLLLLSMGIDPTEENKDNYIQKAIAIKPPEPDCEFDLIIPYEDLFYDTHKIKEQIKEVFNINIVGNWLEKYKKDYDTYLAKA